MPTPPATTAQLLELCSMLRAIAASHQDARPLLRQMAEAYELRAIVDQMPQYGG
ncbi:hypothetical protein [Telmatospirillum siberiense]|uniref:hypothetical protein n=1 Tax=Telmatospirillum siberiense TaxID=382514 RepID=UPI0013046612|nr:hypothetical protein [Telmatospirillum siberiense]